MKLVEAQEGRRMLDRLVGWETSPVLWRVFGRGQAASAGRVQSVAVRMVVERERARMRFRSGQWSDLEGTFVAHGPAVPRRRSSSSTASGSPKAATSIPARVRSRQARANDVVLLDAAERGRARRPAARRRRIAVTSDRVGSVHRAAAGAVHDVDAAAGVGPQAALRARRARCRSRSGSTSGATSPTCVPTAPTCRSRRSPRRAPRSASSTARSTCPTSRVRTAAR